MVESYVCDSRVLYLIPTNWNDNSVYQSLVNLRAIKTNMRIIAVSRYYYPWVFGFTECTRFLAVAEEE